MRRVLFPLPHVWEHADQGLGTKWQCRTGGVLGEGVGDFVVGGRVGLRDGGTVAVGQGGRAWHFTVEEMLLQHAWLRSLVAQLIDVMSTGVPIPPAALSERKAQYRVVVWSPPAPQVCVHCEVLDVTQT